MRGDLTLDDWLAHIEPMRCQLASFIGADRDEIAFLSNSSLGMNFAAQMFAGTGEVATINSEFPSVTLPWLQRYQVQFVESQPDGTISIEDIERAIRPNTKKRRVLVSATDVGLRVSLHFYNNCSDVEHLLSELVEILSLRRAISRLSWNQSKLLL